MFLARAVPPVHCLAEIAVRRRKRRERPRTCACGSVFEPAVASRARPKGLTMREAPPPPKAGRSFAQLFSSNTEKGRLQRIPGATPSSKSTFQFCRFPAPTLPYTPEEANLGELMQSWLRARMCIITSSRFQRQPEAHRTPRITRCFTQE